MNNGHGVYDCCVKCGGYVKTDGVANEFGVYHRDCVGYLQIQYSCTIVWADGYIVVDLPPEWVFCTDVHDVEASVQRRWQVIKGDDNLFVKNFKVISIRADVPVSRNQIGA